MRLKSDRDSLALILSSSLHNLAQNPRMSPVHAVKISYADQRRTQVGRNIFEFVEDLQSQWSATSGEYSMVPDGKGTALAMPSGSPNDAGFSP